MQHQAASLSGYVPGIFVVLCVFGPLISLYLGDIFRGPRNR